MKIILRQDFEKLGKIGDVVEVSEGYARNFILPKKIGFVATEGSLRAFEEEKRQHSQRDKKEQHQAEKLAADLEKVSITITMKVGEDDKLFGSVTTQMLSDALKAKGFVIDKHIIELPETMKALGIYTVDVNLATGVVGKVKVWVVRE